MALITESLEIPAVSVLFPTTRRWRDSKLKPHGTSAAWRRHQRRKTPFCDDCKIWRAGWDASREGRRRGPYRNKCVCQGECICLSIPGQVVVVH